MIEADIAASRTMAQAAEAFARRILEWAHDAMREAERLGPCDSHDQGTFTTGWEPMANRPEARVLLTFMHRLRDRARERFVRQGAWHHGYWRRHETHHGTEHFGIFLSVLHRLSPEDAETGQQLLDAAEHVGNWVESVPAWFDDETGLFRSMWLGTEIVGGEGDCGLNVADHLRLADLSLTAYRVSGEERYLRFADRYAMRWAGALCEGDRIPFGLSPEGPVYVPAGVSEHSYRSFAGMAGAMDDDLSRAENLLASGAVGLFLGLREYVDSDTYLAASRRILDELATQLPDPDAGCVADQMRLYRRTTADSRYDDALRASVDREACYGIRRIGMEPMQRTGPRPPGVGKRNDAPRWFENGAPRQTGPVTVAAVAELDNDERLAMRALDVASAYLDVARKGLRGNLFHGCAANTVSAVLRGHGRENGTGLATGVLRPLCQAFASPNAGAAPDGNASEHAR